MASRLLIFSLILSGKSVTNADTSLRYVSGFVTTQLLPTHLTLYEGHHFLVTVNFTLTRHALSYLPLTAVPCCYDSNTISLDTKSIDLIQRITVVDVNVTALRRGSTILKFYLQKTIQEGVAGDNSFEVIQYDIPIISPTYGSKQDDESNSLNNAERTKKGHSVKHKGHKSDNGKISHSKHKSHNQNTPTLTNDDKKQNKSSNIRSKRGVFTFTAPSTSSTTSTTTQYPWPVISRVFEEAEAEHVLYDNKGRVLVNGSKGERLWWLTVEYNINVLESRGIVDLVMLYIVIGIIVLNIIGAGGQVNFQDAVHIVNKPYIILITILARFIIIPLIGLGISQIFYPADRGVSLVITSLICSPPEGASILLNIIFGQELTLAITTAAFVALASLVFMPLWMLIFDRFLYSPIDGIHIPFAQIVVALIIIVFATLIGKGIKTKCKHFHSKILSGLPVFSFLTLLFIIAYEVYCRYEALGQMSVSATFTSLLVIVSALWVGITFSIILGQSVHKVIVVAIESSIRTTFTTSLLLNVTLPQSGLDAPNLVLLLCCVIALATYTLAASVYRLVIYKRNSMYARTECSSLKSVAEYERLYRGDEHLDTKVTAI